MTVEFTGEIHPAAAVWPMLTEDEIRDLADDIKENGQQVPIVLDAEGRLLDGRNRLAACRIAGVDPWFRVHDGDPVALVLSAEKRRHQSPGQHAMGTAIILKDAGLRRNGRWDRGSVPDTCESASTWAAQVSRAGVVLDHAPELAPLVVTGEQALDAAYRVADAARKRAAQIADLPADLAALVDAQTLTIDEAFDRVAAAGRLADLPDDLTQRVVDGGIDLDEAETIKAERQQRVAATAARIREAVNTISRMVGHPIPDDLAGHLSDAERTILTEIIDTLGRSVHDGLLTR